MKYWEAVKKWNEMRKETGKGQDYCMPKKGTSDYDEVMKMMGKTEAPKKEKKTKAVKEEVKAVVSPIVATLIPGATKPSIRKQARAEPVIEAVMGSPEAQAPLKPGQKRVLKRDTKAEMKISEDKWKKEELPNSTMKLPKAPRKKKEVVVKEVKAEMPTIVEAGVVKKVRKPRAKKVIEPVVEMSAEPIVGVKKVRKTREKKE